MLGTFILWFGWYGFNSGSALIAPSLERGRLVALSAVNTTLSGGMAGLVALFVNLFILERKYGEPIFDLKMAMNGSLSGLVAITAGCGVGEFLFFIYFIIPKWANRATSVCTYCIGLESDNFFLFILSRLVEPWAAMLIGAIAGVLYLGGSNLLIKFRLDDAVDAIPVHMVNGIWGLIAVGLLACPRHLEMTYGTEIEHVGWFYSFAYGGSDVRLLGAQLVGILFILVWCLVIMMPFFVWLDWKGWFRSDPLEEIVGLDTSYHGGLMLMSGDESVNPEYISQFKKQRTALRQRKTTRPGLYDHDEDEESVDDCKLSTTVGTSKGE